jgi:hypothetical protein
MGVEKRRRSLLDRFLEQERNPVLTITSALTTALVWMVIVMDLLHTPKDLGDLAELALLVLAFVVGTLINAIAGAFAFSRREYLGGRVAALGIVLWFLTVALVFFVRGNRLWR